MSRSIERFKNEANKFKKIIEGKTTNEVEKLVSIFSNMAFIIYLFYS